LEPEEIIIELDDTDIEILKRGDAVVKEIDNSDVPHILITKWEIGKEIEDALAEEENIGDMIFEAENPIKIVK